ncbi:MAG TPA: CcdB family protein [Burkholderiaceae bacterium]|nr:CcdB family protein [Burkholderiaceae bacterium]
MARLDVYRNTGPAAGSTPYLLDVQSGWLDGLDTRVVIPLRRLDRFEPVQLPRRLCPVVCVEGTDCLLETPKLAAVPIRLLRGDAVTSLSGQQAAVDNALDFLFRGY